MLFDTDVPMGLSRGHNRAVKALDSSPVLALSIVSLMESLQGSRDRKEQQRIREGLDEAGFTVIPLREMTSHRALSLIEEHSPKDGLRLADALIAATALEATLPLVTGNSRHFRSIAGLAVIPSRLPERACR